MSNLSRREKVEKFARNNLYFVTCEELSLGRSDVEVVDQVLKGGCRLVQLRDKNSSKKVLFSKAKEIRELTNRYQALMMVNDHLDVALSVGADGIHLGQDDLPVVEARRLAEQVNPEFLIGLSTHNLEEVLQVKEDAAIYQAVDYFNMGPVYETNTKENQYPAIFDSLSELVEVATTVNKPFSMMGGIKKKHFSELLAALKPWKESIKNFNTPLAMVTAITEQENIGEQVILYLDCLTTLSDNHVAGQ